MFWLGIRPTKSSHLWCQGFPCGTLDPTCVGYLLNGIESVQQFELVAAAQMLQTDRRQTTLWRNRFICARAISLFMRRGKETGEPKFTYLFAPLLSLKCLFRDLVRDVLF